MKKRLFRWIRRLILIVLIAFGAICFHGYHQYQKYSSQVDIDTLIAEVESRDTYVPYEDLPNTLIRATVSIEDRRYFEHSGVDFKSLVRAIFSQINSNLLKSGGSTITQQLAKNLYGEYESTFNWKVAEFFFAKDLEAHYSKKEILALYVNVINYGNNYTGIYEASMGYFDVAPEDLNDGQCTILAGVPQTPTRYDLSTVEGFQNARQRQRLVLDAMVEMKYLNAQQAEDIYNEQIIP